MEPDSAPIAPARRPQDASRAGSASISINKEASQRLLQHANDVRKHASLDTLDAFIAQSGHTWIEVMISHARDSRESYIQSRLNGAAATGQTFEHRMAAEMLKTPSPKKKRTAEHAMRFPAATSYRDLTQSGKQIDVSHGVDKENQPVKERALPSTPKDWNAKQVSDQHHSISASRATRSQTDKDDLVQLPTTFEARLLQAKNQARDKPTKAHDKPTKAQKQAPVKDKSKAKSKDEGKGEGKTKEHREEKREKASKSAKVQTTSGKDAGDLHIASQGKGATAPGNGIEAPNLESLKTSSEQESSKSFGKAPTVTGMSKNLVDTSNEQEKKESTGSRTDEVTLPWEATRHSPGLDSLHTAPASPQKAPGTEKSIAASSAFLTASSGGNLPVAEDGKDGTRSQDTPFPQTNGAEDTADSPRESTPPPKSPSKQQLVDAAEVAMQKLEASLMKLDDEDGLAVEEHLSLDRSSTDKGAVKTTPDPEAVTLSDEEDAEETEKATAVVRMKTSVTSTAPDEGIPTEPTVISSVAEEDSPTPAPPPKRTLSSISHAKKSLVRSSLGYKHPVTGTPQTRQSVSKGSFLSKSLAQAETETSEKHKVEDKVEGTKFDVAKKVEVETTRKRKSASPQMSDRHDQDKSEERLPKSPSTEPEHARLEDDDNAPNTHTSDKKTTHPTAKQGAIEQRPNATHDDKRQRTSTQPQSLREKIESFHTNKGVGTSQGAAQATRNVGSMSTHSVGIGAKKLSSPIFSRSNSQAQFQTAESGREVAANPVKSDLTSLFKEREIERTIVEPSSGIPRPVAATTTPTHSPGPTMSGLHHSTVQTPSRIPAAVKTGKSTSQRPAPDSKSFDSTLSASDEDALDGTSSDGDLSLVDLRQADQFTRTRASTTAPRPPGAQSRPAGPVQKQNNQAAASVSKTLFKPSSSTNREVTQIAQPNRLVENSASTVTATPASAHQPLAPTTPHGGWGGSISLKLKGILGFATPGASSSSTSTHQSQSKAFGPSSTVRKEPTGASSNVAAKFASISASRNANDKKQYTAERVAQAPQILRKESERELKGKASVDLKKRQREDQAASHPAPATKSKAPGNTQASISRPAGAKAAYQVSKESEESAAKRRKTNENPLTLNKAPTTGSTISHKSSTTQLKPPASGTQKPVPAAMSSTKTQVLKPQPSRANPGQSVFSDQNPFQKAQVQQQDRALAAVSKHLHQTKSQLSQHLPSSAPISTAHIELEEPDSAYSDSEDEETIRRRMQHKPWETRDGLAMALQAQSTVDADMIFGIPQGAVPLDEILPAQTEGARSRRMRPRSSSATWSRDGLKQSEIDRYNERMGIQGPGVKLPTAAEQAADTASRGNGTQSPVRSSGGHRLSAIAQSALAQGQVSKKAERTSMQYQHHR